MEVDDVADGIRTGDQIDLAGVAEDVSVMNEDFPAISRVRSGAAARDMLALRSWPPLMSDGIGIHERKVGVTG